MDAQRSSRLNQLLLSLPDGFLADSAWLQAQGLSRSSIRDYVDRGWLERIGPRVLRGTVHPTELRDVRPLVEERFGFAEIQVVSFEDLYAGKLAAALDRQHPRDLFDVQYLLANEGIDETLFQTFLA